MNEFGKRIYYDSSGTVILCTNDMQGDGVVRPTPEEDAERYIALQERVPGSYAYMELDYGQYAQDFAECSSFRVDVTGEPTLLFSYPDPSQPGTSIKQPKALAEQVAELRESNLTLMEVVADLYETFLGAGQT
ncbi:hypothetical protein ABEW34_21980 [Paenibacillus algorifonticola]|uniref:hypothetical protein n=1 Tax=Paenibacillus algorifonticola TaxID=684063 RepID=UPI003D299AF5